MSTACESATFGGCHLPTGHHGPHETSDHPNALRWWSPVRGSCVGHQRDGVCTECDELEADAEPYGSAEVDEQIDELQAQRDPASAEELRTWGEVLP